MTSKDKADQIDDLLNFIYHDGSKDFLKVEKVGTFSLIKIEDDKTFKAGLHIEDDKEVNDNNVLETAVELN